jgi:hypothetical protein
MASVKIHDEVQLPAGTWHICFQRVTYHYDDGNSEDGYRFIWRRPNNSLQAARGQARIPDRVTLKRLIKMAESQGWLK